MASTGSCMCGAVSFPVTAQITQTNACHCNMCRKWSGGVFFGVVVPKDGIAFDREFFIDFKPEAYAFAGTHRTHLTQGR